MVTRHWRWAAGLLLPAFMACMGTNSAQTGGATQSASPDPRGNGGWQDLQSLSAWRGYKSQEIPKGWKIVNGTITKEGNAEDLVSRDQYGNFEFSLDWMLAKGGNAGI